MKRILVISLMLITALNASAGSDETGAGEAFNRGIERSTTIFIPQGTIGCGVSLSHSNYNVGNAADDVGYKMLFSLIQDLKGGFQSFGVAPYVSYCVTDNLSIGLRFDYDWTKLNVGGVSLNLGDALSMGINDINYVKQAYSGSLTGRYYMPIADSKRFAMFAELRGTGSYAQSQSFNYQGEDKVGTYQDIYKFSLDVIPGLCCFVTNEAALEITIGMLGFNYQKVHQVTNQVEHSEMESSGANFRINLLSINFGVSFYIQTGKHRAKKAKTEPVKEK